MTELPLRVLALWYENLDLEYGLNIEVYHYNERENVNIRTETFFLCAYGV